MAPDGKKREDSSDTESDHAGGPGNNPTSVDALKRLQRKRTKTGCLTCRRRRIKCGEERPVCKNCVKSKRHCDGYNQRVVFRPPTFEFRPTPHGSAHITFQAGPLPGPTAPYETELVYPEAEPAGHSQLRPRPYEYHGPGPSSASHEQYSPPPHAPLRHDPMSQSHPQHPFVFSAGPGPLPAYAEHLRRGSQAPAQYGHPSTTLPSGFYPNEAAAQAHHAHGYSMSDGSPVGQQQCSMPHASQHISDRQPVAQQRTNGGLPQEHEAYSTRQVKPAPDQHRAHHHAGSFDREKVQPWSPGANVARPEPDRQIDYQNSLQIPLPAWTQSRVTAAPVQQAAQHPAPDYHDYQTSLPTTNTPTHILSAAAVETLDDDYYDVQSDDEMEVETATLVMRDYNKHQALSGILNGNHISIPELQMRRYDTFIQNGMLDHYRVEEHANPLRNPATARVFAHFIAVTGPSLSIFERHRRNTSVLFTEGHVPTSQQGLWTYTMPMAALRNQGLLHAMLALASLHIARLTGASVTPSMQHYAWALKRIHHCVGHANKRLKITTIAATMLLGFYEIMTADHLKWNAHLAGSKQLFTETDFVTMTQQFRRMKIERAARLNFGAGGPTMMASASRQDDVLDQIPDIDERVVSLMVGREVRYGDHGQIMSPTARIPQQVDLMKFEILKDLYWWYCKQDAYQSIISGNSLLMTYSRWANCPPRAPLGKPDAVYGSFDHLILLLARIADFAYRDRARKLKQIEANGGHWRPAPGMDVPRPPQPPAPPTPGPSQGSVPPTHQGQPGFPPPPPPAMPAFYGMAPPPRQSVQMPSSYAPLNGIQTPQHSPHNDPLDLTEATQAALKEHDDIRAALHTFSQSLGEAFQPLSAEYQPPIDSPFGTALVYRTFDIGTLWGIYNMAMIIAIRSHPHMPPAAHMAAGVAAKQTAPYAQDIGRIAAGIVPGPPSQQLNPSLGAALNESCMPSFFAAVQYQDAHQRHATVKKIFGIAQRTGWGSAELIASGCETAWVKAAAAGRGPPYTRLGRNHYSDDPRLNGSWERLDPNVMPKVVDDTDRRLIKTQPTARLHWAIGIMGMEEDVTMTG